MTRYARLLPLAGARNLLPFMLLSVGAATLGPLSTVPLGLLVSQGGAAPLITLLLVLLAQELCTALREPAGTAAARRIDGVLRARVRTAASNLPLAHLETPATQADLRPALHGHRGRTPGTAAVAAAGEASRLTSALLGASILALHVWWPAVLALSLSLVQNHRIATMLVGAAEADTLADSPGQARRRRRADYLAEVAGGPAAAKELRVFALQPFFIDRYVAAMRAFLIPQSRGRRAVVRGYGTVLSLQSLSAAGTFAILAWHAGTGLLGPGELARCVLAALLVFAYGAGSHQMFEMAHAREPHHATQRLLTPPPTNPAPTHPATDGDTLAPVGVSSARLTEVEDAPAPESVSFAGPRENADAPAPGSASLARLPTAADTPAPTSASSGRDGSVLTLEGVTFGYPGAETPLLRDLDLHIRPGERLAVVGRNGSGKTTLAKLLCGLYRPDHGEILVDHVPLDRLTPEYWRHHVSAVFQDLARFELTAAETVGVGDLPRLHDHTAVKTALTRADATGLMSDLPHGLATELGDTFEHGVRLSGGQWQKLALARASMRDAPLLLVLDEPTASLDAPAESAVFARYAEAARRHPGAVTLLITHRFPTVRMADLVVVLDGGRIVQQGTHADLVTRPGPYADLHTIQRDAFT